MLLSSYQKRKKKLNKFIVILFLLKSLSHFSLATSLLEFKTCVQHCMGKFNQHTTYWVVLYAQSLSRVALCDPMDCSLAGSSVYGIVQARILEWVAIPSSREASRPRDGTQVLLHLLHWQAPGKHKNFIKC